MKESKSISVSCKEEQFMIDAYQTFGWELLSSQEILSQVNHTEQKSDGVYNVTSTTNYIKLVFSRDTNMANYDKIVELEKQFESLENPKKQKTNPVFKILVIFSIIASVILWLLTFAGGIALAVDFPIPGISLGALIGWNVFCIALTVVCSVLNHVLFEKKANAEYNRLLKIVMEKRLSILQEVKQYVS